MQAPICRYIFFAACVSTTSPTQLTGWCGMIPHAISRNSSRPNPLRTHARTDACTHARMHARTHERTNERTNGRTDGWTDGWMDGWMDGWTDGRTDGSVAHAMHARENARRARIHAPLLDRFLEARFGFDGSSISKLPLSGNALLIFFSIRSRHPSSGGLLNTFSGLDNIEKNI